MLKVGLIGCGRIAERHSEILGGGKIKGAKLQSVCDMNIERAKKIGEKYSVKIYSDMHEMMRSEPLDVVTILTASGNHASNVIELANYKKHIIVEKPMALTLEDADKMISVCDKAGIKLFVIKQNRFNVPVRKAKEAILNNRLGKLTLGTIRVRWCRKQSYYDQDKWRGTWKFDGGVLTNQASHHIDLLEWMMGEVESVSAFSKTMLVNIEAEDTAVAILKFRNGALGIIEATTATRPKDLEGSISLLGEKGTIVIGGFAVNEMKVWNFENEIESDKYVMKNYSVNPPDIYGFGHIAYYNHVVECINNGCAQLVDGLEGRKSLELIHAIYESIELGREVFLRFNPKLTKLGK